MSSDKLILKFDPSGYIVNITHNMYLNELIEYKLKLFNFGDDVCLLCCLVHSHIDRYVYILYDFGSSEFIYVLNEPHSNPVLFEFDYSSVGYVSFMDSIWGWISMSSGKDLYNRVMRDFKVGIIS